MEKEFVTYEQALTLKELGFDEDCLAFYNGKFLNSTDYNFDNGNSKDIGLCISAPLKQQVFRWFREKYELYYRISGVKQSQYHYSIDYQYKDGKWGMMAGDVTTYEEAENACIDKLIELSKQK